MHTTEGQATEGQTTEGQTTEGQTTEGHTTEGQTTEGQATEGQTTEGQNTEGQARWMTPLPDTSGKDPEWFWGLFNTSLSREAFSDEDRSTGVKGEILPNQNRICLSSPDRPT